MKFLLKDCSCQQRPITPNLIARFTRTPPLNQTCKKTIRISPSPYAYVLTHLLKITFSNCLIKKDFKK